MLTEAFGEDLRTSQYYYCATLFVYESIFVLSLLAYVQTLEIHSWSIKERSSAFQSTSYVPSFSVFAQLLFFTTTKIFYWSHWITNTIAHISLCRWEIFGVSKLEKRLQDK